MVSMQTISNLAHITPGLQSAVGVAEMFGNTVKGIGNLMQMIGRGASVGYRSFSHYQNPSEVTLSQKTAAIKSFSDAKTALGNKVANFGRGLLTAIPVVGTAYNGYNWYQATHVKAPKTETPTPETNEFKTNFPKQYSELQKRQQEQEFLDAYNDVMTNNYAGTMT